MQDTVDQAYGTAPRTLADIIEDARRAAGEADARPPGVWDVWIARLAGHTGPRNADGRLRVPTASVTLSDMKAPVPWISAGAVAGYAGLAGLRSGRGRRGQGEHHCYQRPVRPGGHADQILQLLRSQGKDDQASRS